MLVLSYFSPFGPSCEPGRAPETISKAVASLPPEQMFQLMLQMKVCIQNNPQEARTMLLQNPQLAYALLQAQVVMRIVDPETAVTMLHKTPPSVPPVGVAPPGRPPSMPTGPPNFGPPFPGNFLSGMGQGPPGMDMPGPRLDMHGPGGGMDLPGPPRPGMEAGMHRMGLDQGRPAYQAPSMDREDGRAPPRDPRTRDPRDRGGSAGPVTRGPPNPGLAGQGMRPQGGAGRGPQLPAHLAGADPEKAQLIMQVLQLTDEQIAVLPAEQRQSIMVLKEQIKQGPSR